VGEWIVIKNNEGNIKRDTDEIGVNVNL